MRAYRHLGQTLILFRQRAEGLAIVLLVGLLRPLQHFRRFCQEIGRLMRRRLATGTLAVTHLCNSIRPQARQPSIKAYRTNLIAKNSISGTERLDPCLQGSK